MKVAIYSRVSTAHNGQDPTVQTREPRECCERRGWQVAGEYVDVGIGRSKDPRPELNKLMSYLTAYDSARVYSFALPAM